MAPANPTSSRPSPRKVSFETQSQRPVLKKKVTSPTGASLLGGLREVSHEVIEPPKPDMAASFLQFCAMCEKQIMTPCNSILYCSEACRRKDGCKPLSAATLFELTPPSSSPSSPSKPILLARTPTGSYPDPTPSKRIPPELHDHSSDLDPTEWKPKLRKSHGRQSEAFRYLSQFHQSTTTLAGSDEFSSPAMASTNVAYHRGSSVASTIAASMPLSVPSLWSSSSSTPTTTASTLSSNSFGNVNITGHDYAQSHGGWREFSNSRPLPARHNRWYSVSGATPKGVDLVTPHVAPPTVDVEFYGAEAGEDLWGKKIIVQTERRQGQMGALFRKV